MFSVFDLLRRYVARKAYDAGFPVKIIYTMKLTVTDPPAFEALMKAYKVDDPADLYNIARGLISKIYETQLKGDSVSLRLGTQIIPIKLDVDGKGRESGIEQIVQSSDLPANVVSISDYKKKDK